MRPLERAARAVRDDIAYPHGDGSYVVEGGFRDERFFIEVARAVLEAIREPSEAMTLAVDEAANGHGEYIWQTMIDAALSDPGKP